MKITPPCTKSAVREASRMVGVKTFNLWGPWKSVEMLWRPSMVPHQTIFCGLRKAKKEKSVWGLSADLSCTEPAWALLQNLLCASAISSYYGGAAMGGGSFTNLCPSGWREAGWWNTRARRERGDVTPFQKFLYAYRILSGEPHIWSAKDSSIYIKHIRNLKRSLSFRPNTMLVPRYTSCCYYHGWWCCSQLYGRVLPLARHRPGMKRQLHQVAPV